MSLPEYKIKSDNIKGNSEETSAVSKISYEIENANNNGLNDESIKRQIKKRKIIIDFLKTCLM